MARFRSLEESAARAGHYCWLEQRLFEILGSWAPAVSDPELKLLLRTESFRHGRHAQGWLSLLPATAHVHAPDLIRPPNPGVEEVMATGAGVEEPDAIVDMAVALHGAVVAGMVSAYEHDLAEANPVSDGPTMRWLSAVLDDERDARHEVDAALQPVLARPDRASGAMACLDGLQSRLTAAGGLVSAGGSPISPAPPFQRQNT